MRYTHDVVLPDGRQFHVTARFTAPERDTNSGGDLIDVDIEDMDGNELDADAYSEEIPNPNPHSYRSKTYLWELCVDLVCQYAPDEPDEDWF